jgi:cell division protease FtsH
MKEYITKFQSALKEKQQELDHVKRTLKSEFVGIDSVIDKVFEWIGPWYMFPEMQEKPLVINLWGITGVGKSSLVNRLVELLDFHNRHYRFDMG